MYKEDKFGGGFGVLLLILKCGSESRRLSILQIFVIVEKSRVLEGEERNTRIWYYLFIYFIFFSN
jgi:hypothetical protein